MKRKVPEESMSPFETKHLFSTPFRETVYIVVSSRSSGENEIAAAIWGRDRFNWGGGCFASFLFGGYFLRYELFSIGGVTRTGLIGGGLLIRSQH